MSWHGWNQYYYNRGKEDFESGENHPPEDNEVFHPGAFDLDGGKTFTTSDAQSSYDAGRSDAGGGKGK